MDPFSFRSLRPGGSEVVCPHCQAANPPDTNFCVHCQRNLIVGKLTSLGTGVLTKGFAWEMRPRLRTLGRSVGNDFVIPSNLVAGEQLRFTYQDGEFRIGEVAASGKCRVNGEPLEEERLLHDGDVLTVGVEELLYQRLDLTGVAEDAGGEPLSEQLQLLLGIMAEFFSSPTLQELVDNAVDAVLRLTHLQRGFAFFVDDREGGEIELREVSARVVGGRPMPEADTGQYSISQAVIQRVISSEGMIYLHDAFATNMGQDNSPAPPSLRSVACVPMVTFHPRTGRKHVMGLIYADAVTPICALPENCRPRLQMLAQLITSTVARLQNHERMEHTFISCQRAVRSLDHDLSELNGEVQALLRRLDEKDRVNQISREELRLDLEAVQARLQIVQGIVRRLQPDTWAS